MIRPDQTPIGFTVEGVIALAGGPGAVADKLGLTIQGVLKWTDRVPAIHARQVAIMAGLPLEIVHPAMVRRTPAEA